MLSFFRLPISKENLWKAEDQCTEPTSGTTPSVFLNTTTLTTNRNHQPKRVVPAAAAAATPPLANSFPPPSRYIRVTLYYPLPYPPAGRSSRELGGVGGCTYPHARPLS